MKPILTVVLCFLATGLMLANEATQALLYFDRQQVAVGNFWSLVTGHFVHADWGHLLWNLIGLAVLGYLIERHSRGLLLLSLGMGIVAVNTLLLSPFSEIQLYCGLSGVLNTLLGVALYCRWRETQSLWMPVIGLLSFAKIGVEVHSGASLFTDISWPPYPLAHLAGLLGAPLVLLIRLWRPCSHQLETSNSAT